MKPAARAALALCAALALLGLLAALAAGGALLWGLLQHTVQIAIDGQPVELPAWAWPEGVVVGAAVLLGGGVLVLLLPLAVLLGLGLPVLVVVVVAGALLGSLGLALAAMLSCRWRRCWGWPGCCAGAEPAGRRPVPPAPQ